jgi:hypothetical protein
MLAKSTALVAAKSLRRSRLLVYGLRTKAETRERDTLLPRFLPPP